MDVDVDVDDIIAAGPSERGIFTGGADDGLLLCLCLCLFRGGVDSGVDLNNGEDADADTLSNNRIGIGIDIAKV